MGSSVLWCHIRLIWVACGSLATCLMCHAVAFELSNFFANWQTLLLENFSRSTLPSVMILDTKSSSHRKNQSMLQCNIFAVSGRYFSKFTCACTALYHSLTLLFPWWKLVNISNQACTSLDCSLQKSSNLSHIVSRFMSSLDSPRIHIHPFQSCQTTQWPFYTFDVWGGQWVHIPKYFCIWVYI